MHNLSIGVDLHKQQFTVCFLVENDEVLKKYSTEKVGIECFKKDVKLFIDKGFRVRIAVETTGNTRYFYNQLSKLGCEVFIVNTLKFKIVNESVNKTDKRDAKVIATFLSKDMLPVVKLSSEKSENLRQLVGVRNELVRTRVKLKNKIHGILLSLGIKTKAGQLNSVKGINNVLSFVDDAEKKLILETIIDSIKSISERVKVIEEKMMSLTENTRAVKILKSIPGTGLLNSVTVASYIDEIKRFSHYNKFSAYCGLVPWVQCSDETKHYGRITKRGPIELRTAIIQMVIGMIRCKDEKDNRLMTSYRNIKKIKGSGKALVATARKLTKIIWTMLTNDEEYKKEKANSFYDQIQESELMESKKVA